MESFEIRGILKAAWEKFKGHFVFLWLLGGVYIGTVAFFSLLGERFEEGSFPNIVMAISSAVLGMIVQLGCIKALLDLVATNEEKGIAIVFSQYRLFWRYLFASILFQLLVVLGFILLIIPGVYFMMKYQFYSYAMIDKNLGIMESFRKSAEMTKGRIWKLVGFSFVLLLLNLVGALFLGIGLLVTLPVTFLAYTSLYFTLQNLLETARQAQPTPAPAPIISGPETSSSDQTA